MQKILRKKNKRTYFGMCHNVYILLSIQLYTNKTAKFLLE